MKLMAVALFSKRTIGSQVLDVNRSSASGSKNSEQLPLPLQGELWTQCIIYGNSHAS